MPKIRVTHGTTMGSDTNPNFDGTYGCPSTVIELGAAEMWGLASAIRWGLNHNYPDPDGSMRALAEMLVNSSPRQCFKNPKGMPAVLRPLDAVTK